MYVEVYAHAIVDETEEAFLLLVDGLDKDGTIRKAWVPKDQIRNVSTLNQHGLSDGGNSIEITTAAAQACGLWNEAGQ